LGILLAVLFVCAMIVIPIIKILQAKYITSLEKIIWFLLSILGIPIQFLLDYPYSQALKNSTNHDEVIQLLVHYRASSFNVIYIFWAVMIFLIFKITYSRRQGLWEEKHKEDK
jgi:hypothetical protein